MPPPLAAMPVAKRPAERLCRSFLWLLVREQENTGKPMCRRWSGGTRKSRDVSLCLLARLFSQQLDSEWRLREKSIAGPFADAEGVVLLHPAISTRRTKFMGLWSHLILFSIRDGDRQRLRCLSAFEGSNRRGRRMDVAAVRASAGLAVQLVAGSTVIAALTLGLVFAFGRQIDAF